MSILLVLVLVALGMVVDMAYHRKIRLVALDAYKDGYQAALRDHVALHDPVRGDVPQNTVDAKPGLPDGFEEHMRQNGQATAWLK